MLDCCHSGTGTRIAADDGAVARRAPTDTRQRPVSTFLLTPQEATAFALSTGRDTLHTGGWFALPGGRDVDVTLDEMRPGSDFLRTLADSPDPGTPYAILAGNTALLPHALEPERTKPALIERLLARLAPERLREAIANLAFFGQPNDIAVSIASSSGVPATRVPAPQIREVASDHLLYFNSAQGLKALAEALEA